MRVIHILISDRDPRLFTDLTLSLDELALILNESRPITNTN